MRHITFILFALITLTSYAQTTFTAHLRKQQSGKGTVIITQSQEIEQLVNGKATQATPAKSSSKPADKAKQPSTKNAAHETTKTTEESSHTHAAGSKTEGQDTHTSTTSKHHIDRTRHKAQGFRICIFTGGNSRKDKTKAYEMAEKCRQHFSELATYPTFAAPRWVTHVGDFRTRQDAQKYVTLIRKSRITYEVRIVKSEVNLPD